MANDVNASAAITAHSPDALNVESAVIQIDAVIAAMAAIAGACGAPTNCILWTLTYALNDSVGLLKGEPQS